MAQELSAQGAESRGVGHDPSLATPLLAGPEPVIARGEGVPVPPPRSARRLEAGEGVLLIEDVDVAAVRQLLAQVGAEGSASLAQMTPSETSSLLAGLRDLSGAIAAVEARALVHLEDAVKEDCRRREETPRQALRIARAEAALALKQSSSGAGRSLSSSRRLVRSMPGMLAALARGQIVPAAAHRVGRTMGPATPEQRTLVDEILCAHLPYLADCGPEEWGGEAEKVLHGLDPQGMAERHREAKRERGVTIRRGEHGMCTLTARLTGLDGARIRKGLSIAAEKARAGGDRRGHQQIMADLLADALIGRGEGIDPSTLEIGVIITDRSLLAPEHADAATLEGYGPVPFDHVRAEMLEAVDSAQDDPELAMTLRRLYLDTEDGQLIAADSRARAFPPSMSRFLRIAHQTCRAPHCDASIRQNDHIDPWAMGGATALDNGNGLCAADNQKEEAGLSVRVLRDADGTRRTVEWISRHGQTAQRRAINHDPLGTGRRLLNREAEPAPASRARSRPPGQDSITPERPHAEPRSPMGHALTLVEPLEPSEQPGAGLLRTRPRRRDHVFLPHLTLIVDAPWHGPETNAA